ncbi:MAG: hypothetical protein ACLP4W_09920 [Mycobacterium sp.]|uniref:hypothetical protein n=1 Tax=Mycobacterium sp. TaxID=1785 RepID=UPI003F9B3FD1
MTIDGKGPGQSRPATGTVAQPRPATPETVVQSSFRAFKAAVDAQNALNAEAGKQAEEKFRRGILTEQGLREARPAIAADSPIAQMVDKAEQGVADREAAARQRYDNLLAGMVQKGDAAQEARNDRYLARVQRELDAADSPGKKLAIAQGLMEKADPAQVGVLVEELPSLFAGHDTSWVEAKLAQVNPQLGAAVTDVKLSAQCTQMATHAAKKIRDGFESGSPPTKLDVLSAAVQRLDPDRQ